MGAFDFPTIDVERRSNEENIKAIKSYLFEMTDQLNYEIDQIKSQIQELNDKIASLGGK